MRLVWQSNSPTTHSGYGKQTALFVPRINALSEHEVVAIVSPYNFGGCPISWNDIPILGIARDGTGCDTILRNHEYFKADLTVVLADPFGLLKVAGDLKQIPLAMWFPVDCDPAGKGDITVLRESAAIPIAMSHFGKRTLENEGAEPLFAPHAVDVDIYKPGDPSVYRDTLPGVTSSTFVIGVNAMNRDMNRKGFYEQFEAFARFHASHPDSFLAVHSTPAAVPGLSLEGMAARLGISTAIGFPDSYSYDLNLVTEEQMATWYNGLDILSFCSFGEGFGLPLIEAQACGIPVVTTDASAMSELCGAGFLVSGTPFWTDGHQSFWKRPDVSDIVQAYEGMYASWERGCLPKQQAFDFAQQFAVDKVFEDYWVPVLGQLEEMIG